MSAPLIQTGGGGGSSSPTNYAAPAFFFPGMAYGCLDIGSNGSGGVVVANRVEVVLFFLSNPITVSKVTARVTTGAAATTFNCGVYNVTGTSLLIDSGSMSSASSNTTVSATLGSPVTLQAGFYYAAFACTDTTPTFSVPFSVNNAGVGFTANQNQNRLYIGGNSLSAGALPGSIGTVTINNSMTPKIMCFEA